MNTESDKEIELRSEAFQEILGTPPSWMLRCGIIMATVIAMLLLIGSAVFKYPDSVSSSIVLTGTIPVSDVVAQTSGKLEMLYIQDNQYVKKNDYLAIIDNPANTEDVFKFKDYLNEVSENTVYSNPIPPEKLQLGSMQSLYESFYIALLEYKQFVELDYHPKKIEFTKTRIKQNEKHYQNMLRQYSLVQKQYSISHTQYKRDSILMDKGVFSPQELESTHDRLLQSELSLEMMNSSMESLLEQIGQLNETLFETEHQYVDKDNSSLNNIKSLYAQLKAEFQSWEMIYVLKSPIDGEITFTEYWTKNQNITTGVVIFNIVPQNKGKLIGKALMPTERSGKVKKGQKVNVYISNFPDVEYGVLQGFVNNISLVPSKGSDKVNYYVVEINFPKGLITTYNKRLPFLSKMEGKADIITDDLSVIERLLLPLKEILTKNL